MGDEPVRIQRSRAKGWRMPEGAIYVGRPTIWGNPFPVNGGWSIWATVALGRRNEAANRVLTAIDFYRRWLLETPLPVGRLPDSRDRIEFESGIYLSTSEHAQGIAASMAMIEGASVTAPAPPSLAEIRDALHGHDLACWCPLVDTDGKPVPCHADVLIEIANAPSSSSGMVPG